MPVVKFKLAGFSVQVMPGHWLLLLMLGMLMGDRSLELGAVVVAASFVSIMVHELGHALAARAFGLRAHITLYMMGGATLFEPTRRLSRGQDVAVSFAGPLAGFVLAAIAFFLSQLYAPTAPDAEASTFIVLLMVLWQINLFWSVLNLVPVVPFDGGRILVALLGPARQRVAGGVSLAVGMGAAAVCLRLEWPIAAFLFASNALSSFLRMRDASSQPAEPVDEEALERAARAANEALQQQRHDEASALAQGVLSVAQQPKVRQRALEVLLWARLGAEDAAGARTIALSASADSIDPYLLAAVHEAAGFPVDAQRVLVAHHAEEPGRLEVTALLVKVLLQQDKFGAAARLALEIAEETGADESRQVARLCLEGGASEEAAALYLQLADGESSFDDARQAALAFAAAKNGGKVAEAVKVAQLLDPLRGQELLEEPSLEPFRQGLGQA